GPTASFAVSPFVTRCRREDSNLHSLNGNQVLNLARLPVPPLRLGEDEGEPPSVPGVSYEPPNLTVKASSASGGITKPLSADAQQPALAVHRGVARVPQRLPHPRPLLQDRNLFRRAGHGAGWPRRQRRRAVEVIDAAVSELARGRILVPQARRVVARPAQA